MLYGTIMMMILIMIMGMILGEMITTINIVFIVFLTELAEVHLNVDY